MISFLLALIDEESDKEFFIKLYSAYQKQMRFKAYDVLGDNNLAEDAVQNAFIGIAKNIKTVRALNEAYIRPYLLIAAKHAAIDIVKKSTNEIAIGNFYDGYNADEIDEIAQCDERSYIFHILNKMPQKYRDVLYLLLVLKLTEKEISTVLNIKLNTVRQQVLRGRKMFAELYEKGLNENEFKSI